MALEVLLLPKVFSPELYSEIEYQKFILYFVTFFLFGANSGYVYCKYNDNKDYFYSLLTIGSIVGAGVSIVLFLYYQNIYFSLSSFLMFTFLIVEQKIKVENEFFLALAIKPLISMTLSVYAILYYKGKIENYGINFLYISIVVSFFIWITLVMFRLRTNFSFKFKVCFTEYGTLISKGFFVNIATLLFMGFFFSDRYITKEYYPEYLASYSFSYNLIQFVVLALTTIGYVNVVKMGENIKEMRYSVVLQTIKYSYKLFLSCYILFGIFLFVISPFFDFQGFVLISLLMAAFVGHFHVINSVSSLAQYLDFQRDVVFMMFILVVLNLISSYILIYFKLSYFLIIIKSGLLLNLYIWHVLYKIRSKLL